MILSLKLEKYFTRSSSISTCRSSAQWLRTTSFLSSFKMLILRVGLESEAQRIEHNKKRHRCLRAQSPVCNVSLYSIQIFPISHTLKFSIKKEIISYRLECIGEYYIGFNIMPVTIFTYILVDEGWRKRPSQFLILEHRSSPGSSGRERSSANSLQESQKSLPGDFTHHFKSAYFVCWIERLSDQRPQHRPVLF